MLAIAPSQVGIMIDRPCVCTGAVRPEPFKGWLVGRAARLGKRRVRDALSDARRVHVFLQRSLPGCSSATPGARVSSLDLPAGACCSPTPSLFLLPVPMVAIASSETRHRVPGWLEARARTGFSYG